MSPSKQNAPENDVAENPILFWAQQLDINTPILELPADFPRSPTTSYRIGHVSFLLPDSCYDALEQLDKQLDTKLFTTILAAYNALLFRYTGQEDIVIGYPALENKFNETGELIGKLYNTKVYRTDLSDNPSFCELLQRVNHIVEEGNRHQDVPYEELENMMKLELGANYTGLYNVIFSFRNTEVENNEINNWTANISVPENARGAIDLALYIEETIQGLRGVWTYNSALFEAETIKRLAKHFEVLLGGIVSDPQETIARLPLLTDKEHHQLTVEWNNTAISHPVNKCIHELFEAQVRKTPKATALVFDNKELTYAELNERANQLGHYLRNRGVKKEILVPVCMGRSLEMIIGIWGILKAGGAYVPVDPNYPLERIAFLLYDTGASVVIGNKESKTKLETFQNIDFVELNPESSFLEYQSVDNLNIDVSSNNLAYVIYTSGTTGKPKGVMIEHRSLANYLLNSKTTYINRGEQISGSFIHLSYTFDASLTAIFMPLLSGKLVALSSKNSADVFEDINLLKYGPYDFLKITPVHLELIHSKLKDDNGKLLTRKLVIGGEALLPAHFSHLIEEDIDIEIINEYGPTEATVGCSTYNFYPVKDYDMIKEGISIGKPIDNTQLYILDQKSELVPVGITGEICIGGIGLSRGYLNRPELTAEKFISNPFSKEHGTRLYRTGDMGRWLPDGNIAYLGRMDDQIKVRGYRIELGEIEKVLNQSDSVHQAVVLANTDKKGNKHLIGYVVPRGMFDKQAIRDYLSRKLPEYMVPSLWVELDKLPLTSNGKIDRKTLPDPDLTGMLAEYVAPANETERVLAELWRELLGIERVGIYDNFFDLGGNSMYASILFAKIKKKFHKDFSFATIFSAPTIYQLAVAIKEPATALSSFKFLIPIQPNGSKTPLFCVHGGWGDVLFYERLATCLGQDQPFYGIQARGMNGIERPSSQMEQMADDYISEIRKVQPKGPYYLGGFCLGAQIIFEMAQQLTLQGEKVALLANLNGISPTYNPASNRQNAGTNGTSQGVFAKASNHLNGIAKLSLMEKVIYISKKLKRQVIYKLRRLFYLVRNKAMVLLTTAHILLIKLVCNLYFLFKQKIPERIARFYVGYLLYELQTNYKPKAYAGSMAIFRSPGLYTEPTLGWKSFVQGEIKTFDIPGMHIRRKEIMNEPFVQFLAKELKNCLDN